MGDFSYTVFIGCLFEQCDAEEATWRNVPDKHEWIIHELLSHFEIKPAHVTRMMQKLSCMAADAFGKVHGDTEFTIVCAPIADCRPSCVHPAKAVVISRRVTFVPKKAAIRMLRAAGVISRAGETNVVPKLRIV